MRGRHARRRVPLAAVVPVLAVAAAATLVAWSAPEGGGDGVAPPGERSAGGAPGPSEGASPRPAGTAAEELRRERIVIHGTGDVSLDPGSIPAFAVHGYGYAWSGLGGLFRRDDLTVVNLECPVTTRHAPLDKRFVFRCDPAGLPAMRRAGVEVANLGNNHAYDHGPAALVDSLAHLRRAGITPVGAGRDEREALRAAVLEVGGWRVAVVRLDMVVDPYPEAVAGPAEPGTAAGHDVGAMLGAIRRAAARSDLVVVTIHWGVELDTEPRAEQVALGHRFVRAGADVIFGHHAHRLQPMGVYRGRPIFWGLGNFVWPALSTEGATTAVARVVVTPGGRIRGRLLPASIEDHGHPVLR